MFASTLSRSVTLASLTLLVPSATAGDPTVLHDNGVPDLLNGLSNATRELFGARRALLDDFVVPFGETWTLERFEWHHGPPEGNEPPFGTGAEVAIWSDAGGAPGLPLETLAITSYSEKQTGNFLFSTEETISWVDFEPVALTAGHYWIENAIVSHVLNFWYTASPIQHEMAWINYEDFGFMPVVNFLGQQHDLSWRLFGQRDVPGEWACCFPDGNCLTMAIPDCETQGGFAPGVGVECDVAVCGVVGACCFLDNTCAQQSDVFCSLEGGVYAGVGVPCAGAACNACGEFGAPVDLGSAHQLALGDVDGDLDIDIVGSRNTGVAVFLNDGTGGFGAPVTYATPASVEWIAIGDIDGDLDLDVATTRQNGPAWILRNEGNGTFGLPETYETGDRPWVIALADVDGDLAPDLIVLNNDDFDVSIRLNDGTGAFGPRTDFPTGPDPRSATLADFDGDLDLDIAVNNDLDAETASFLFNNGDGTFQPPVAYQVSPRVHAVQAIDVDGDHDQDLAAIGADEIILLRNDGAGTFVRDDATTFVQLARSLTSGDVDGDEDLDLVVTKGAGPPQFGGLVVLRNEGDGTFTRVDTYDSGRYPRYPVLGELDGDGAIDIVVEAGPALIYFNDCPPCVADLDGSGAVDFGDILAILGAWGQVGVPEDLDGSGVVDFGDLLVVLGAWGPC